MPKRSSDRSFGRTAAALFAFSPTAPEQRDRLADIVPSDGTLSTARTDPSPISAWRTQVRTDPRPVAEVFYNPVDHPPVTAQVGAQLAYQPHHLDLLLSRTRPLRIRTTPRQSLCRHGPSLAAKLQTRRPHQTGSRGRFGVDESGCGVRAESAGAVGS